MKDKKITFTQKYCDYLAKTKLDTSHFKVLMLLHTNTFTQSQIAEILEIKHKQNINATVKTLLLKGLVEVDRIEGSNKFLRATNPVELAKVLVIEDFQIKGQVKLPNT
jgi:DNA-binding MarR family transcriptional regulator